MADKFQLKAILTAVDKLSPTLKGISRTAKITHKSLRDIGRSGAELMTKIGLPAGLAFGAVAYGAINATRRILEWTGAIQDASERTGVGVENYQALVNMLGEVGASEEDAQMAAQKFNKGMADAAAGADKSFAGLMRKLKIPLKDGQGNIRTLTDVLPELADAFQKNTNPAQRTRMAMELLGKSGSKIIPVLMQGGDAVRSMIAEQERLGQIVGKDSVAAMDDLDRSIGIVSTQIRSQLTQSLAKLVPVIKPMIGHLTEWIAANKELIQTSIVGVLRDVATAVQEIDWLKMIREIRSVLVTVKDFVGAIGGVRTVLIGLGVAFLAGPVAAILTIGSAIYRAVSAISLLVVANPVILTIVAAAAALAGIAYLIYRNWKTIGPTIMGAIGPMLSALSSLWTALVGLGKTWFAAFAPLVAVLAPVVIPILKFIGRLIGGVITLAFILLTTAVQVLAGVLTFIIERFTKMVTVIGNVVSAIGRIAKAAVPDWLVNMFGGKSVNISAPQAQPPLVQSGAPQAQTPLVQSGAIGMANGKQQLSGDMTVRFENAPPGMRVDRGKTNQPMFGFNADVGYRTLGMGL